MQEANRRWQKDWVIQMSRPEFTIKECKIIETYKNNLDLIDPLNLDDLGIAKSSSTEDILEKTRKFNKSSNKTQISEILEHTLSTFIKTKMYYEDISEEDLEFLNNMKMTSYKMLMKLIPERFG